MALADDMQRVVPTVVYNRVETVAAPGAIAYPLIVVRATRNANFDFDSSLYSFGSCFREGGKIGLCFVTRFCSRESGSVLCTTVACRAKTRLYRERG